MTSQTAGSRSRLIPVDQAIEAIMAGLTPSAVTQTLPLSQTLGRVLATKAVARVSVPSADTSAMDGYALRIDDIHQTLPVSQRIPAGTVAMPLAPATCARVFTGAQIPPGANLVVMQEEAQETPQGIKFIGAHHPHNTHSKGSFIRRQGQDISQGNEILNAGCVLSPRHLSLLAAAGIDQVEVYTPLKVAIIATGNELVSVGEPLAAGQIYNSNRYQLAGMLKQLGMEVLDLGIVKDNRQATRDVLAQASVQADLVITSGGVSVGEEDHVKACVEALGQLDVWKLAIKPGKPLAFGRINNTPFFGLPGNPASVLVTFMLLVRPYLMKRQGINPLPPLTSPALLSNPPVRTSDRQEYLRVKHTGFADGVSVVEALPDQNSGRVSTGVAAHGLAMVPANTEGTYIKWVDYYAFNRSLY